MKSHGHVEVSELDDSRHGEIVASVFAVCGFLLTRGTSRGLPPPSGTEFCATPLAVPVIAAPKINEGRASPTPTLLAEFDVAAGARALLEYGSVGRGRCDPLFSITCWVPRVCLFRLSYSFQS